jgi:hypothetical protein
VIDWLKYNTGERTGNPESWPGVNRVIEQATYLAPDSGGFQLLAHSPGFRKDWLLAAERLCSVLGKPPAGGPRPDCVFAQPFGAGRVAVVLAAGRPDALAFRLLILPAVSYAASGGDPFAIADRFTPDWQAHGELPALEWADEPPPERTVESIQKLLKAPHSAFLLGGVQALLEGGRLVVERSTADEFLLRGLWALLPTGDRCRMWPASFAYHNGGQFHVVVVPAGAAPGPEGYIDEEEAADYPEGRYEVQLQQAAEAGDQRHIDALFSGRKRAGVLRLVLLLLALVVLNLPFAMMFLPPPPAAHPAIAPVGRPDAAPEKPNPEKASPPRR